LQRRRSRPVIGDGRLSALTQGNRHRCRTGWPNVGHDAKTLAPCAPAWARPGPESPQCWRDREDACVFSPAAYAFRQSASSHLRASINSAKRSVDWWISRCVNLHGILRRACGGWRAMRSVMEATHQQVRHFAKIMTHSQRRPTSRLANRYRAHRRTCPDIGAGYRQGRAGVFVFEWPGE
jgi:hypothetical protein